MLSHATLQVRFDEFAAAASRLLKMKRAPRGSKGSIPSDTLLSAHGEGILVETSVVSSLVNSDRPWNVNVSVDAKRLIEVCEVFQKLGAAGHGIEVSIEMQKLCLKFRTTKISIPTLSVEAA
jgi:hypothetical protein